MGVRFRSSKWIAIAACLILLILAVLNLHWYSSPRVIPVTIGDRGLKAWVADTDSLRSKGLSGKSSMPSNYGMLFLFPEAGYYTFWMKDMNFPLDFVWIRDKKIIDVTSNVQPPKSASDPLPYYLPKEEVDAVLELHAGAVSKYGLHVGNIVNF